MKSDWTKPQPRVSSGQSIEAAMSDMNVRLPKRLHEPMGSSNGDLKKEIHIPAMLGHRLKQYVRKVPGFGCHGCPDW